LIIEIELSVKEKNYIMKYVLVFLLLGLTVAIYSQKRYRADETNYYDIKRWEVADLILKSTQETVTGVVYSKRDNGQLIFESNYENGKIDGSYKSWYKNGQLSYKSNYKNGKEVGLSSLWYENGQMRSEENFINGKLDGFRRA